jgi:stearoyl-CoA desaturase (delta-9 desaturase)
MNAITSPAPPETRLDIPFTVINMLANAAMLVLPILYHSTSSIVAFLIFYTISGLGLTVGYHRLFSHHAFAVPKWLEHTIAWCGYLAIQRGPIFWAAMHRLHHKYTDVPGKDPHSPKEGIWHVHFGWVQNRRRDVWDEATYHRLVPDLVEDRLYQWMDREPNDYLTYFSLVFGSILLGGLLGFAGPEPHFDWRNALCFVVWVGLLHRVALLHAFGLINSVCHLFGTQPYQGRGTDRSSRNNFLVALVIFGEGWHNNHHAYPTSARQGLRWYQIDPAWYVIWLLKKMGLATQVKLAATQIAALPLSKNPRQPIHETYPEATGQTHGNKPPTQ